MAEGAQGLRELSDRGRTLKLPDGRALGYRIYGPEDGIPAFYFHGFPGSRLEAGFAGTPGIKLIAPDRPGYGLSDPFPGRRLGDWPADVGALADHLGHTRFAVLGISGGAPYALACAAALAERMTSAAIVCGVGPFDAPGMRMGMMRVLTGLGRNRAGLIPLALLGRYMLARGDAEARFLEFRRRMTRRLAAGVPREQEVSTDDLASHLYRTWHEGLRRSTSGVVSDARIYAAPWPFDIGAIKPRIHIWHGTQDRVVPVSIAHYYSERIPHAAAHIVDGEGHFSIILNSLPKIVRVLIDEAAR